MTDELTAINMMLDTISEAPVSSVDSTLPEAVQARRTLDRINREVQSLGLHCNRDFDVTLTPSAVVGPTLGYVSVPANTLSIKARYGESWVQRGAYLYDVDNQTFVFTQPISVDTVTLLDFDDLPEAHRYYIAVRAARVFQHLILGSDSLESFTARDEGQAKVVVDGVEMRMSGHRMCDYRPVNMIMRRRF